jgi:hypothetical protein
MTYAFDDPTAPGRKLTQCFENNGSRAIYHDGWIAAAFGPLIPWLPVTPGLDTWDANKDRWELYNIRKDFSEADDLAAQEPERLEEMKKLFLAEAKDNQVFRRGLVDPSPSRGLVKVPARLAVEHTEAGNLRQGVVEDRPTIIHPLVKSRSGKLHPAAGDVRLDRQGAAVLAPFDPFRIDRLRRDALFAGDLEQPQAHARPLDPKPVNAHARPGSLDPRAIEIIDVPQPGGGAAQQERSDVPIQNHHFAALEGAG